MDGRARGLAEWIVGELDAVERAESDPSAKVVDAIEDEEWRKIFFKRSRELAEIILGVTDCPHARLIQHPGDETFHPRNGCLDCNKWLEPVRLRGEKT